MKRLINPLIIILFAVALRILPHPPNFAPIAGMALFGGAYLNKRYALIAPLVAMFISDIFLGFHSGMLFVYGSFLIIGLLGVWLRKNKNMKTITLATFFSSFIFFAITNFGVWLAGGLYPRTIEGFVQCYFYAIPFFRNTILGDLFYVGIFFGCYELALFPIARHNIRKVRV